MVILSSERATALERSAVDLLLCAGQALGPIGTDTATQQNGSGGRVPSPSEVGQPRPGANPGPRGWFPGHDRNDGDAVPRYLIDTNDDDTFVEDDVGQDLPNAEEARKAAHRALTDMARDKMPDGDGRTFCASVRNEAGTVIYKATLTLDGEWKAEPQFQ
ncbi:hypothetical protein LOK46_32295 (plasmid) [Methylobacterium sp. NMS14P]|uniref:DUF6894 family protein n=1 Tax=Methylobacterium sp. NMS14P TaxID=2894310 RepID=UPI00235854AC|nr:hypothetical protein [Methylobacterium sp. NMS14P]WCS28587.1 hypothetical protein LOK46_32295 [Methylobacterium sp. NMS14P]